MKTLKPLFGASGAIALLLTASRMIADPAKPVSYWPFAQGSTWTLSTNVQNKTFDQIITVTSVKTDKGGSVATLNYTAGSKVVQVETYRTTPQEVARMSAGLDGSGVLSPPLPIIKYPMKAGNTWKWSGTITVHGVPVQGVSTLTVSGPTSVKTMGGTFSAFKVHSELVVTAQGQTQKVPNDYWFAPNVGLVRQQAQIGALTVDGSLKSYKLK